MGNIRTRILELGIVFFFLCLCHVINTGGCIEKERRALLAIKADIYQPPKHKHWLSSWSSAAADSDCCTWQGVGCDNETGHVTKVDLRYPFVNFLFVFEEDTFTYSGRFPPGPSKLNPSLLNLMHLKYLDVSKNNFRGMPIPEFVGSLSKLEYLNLSYTNFGGIVPPQIGNLSSLRFLDLNSKFRSYPILSMIGFESPSALSVGNSLHWLSHTPFLRYLDMSGLNLSMVSEFWMHDINKLLPSLSVLILSDVGLNSIPATLEHVNFTSLTVLDLSKNNFGGFSVMPNWIFNISSLVHLDLSRCSQVINMQFLEMLAESAAVHLKFLNLRYTNISGEIPEKLGNLSQLEVINFANNQLTGSIPESVGKLSRLEVLELGYNQLNGSIPESVGKLNRLKLLDFGYNQLSGSIPETVGDLYNLHNLILSNNNIGGDLPTAAIGGLYCNKLKNLDLSANNISGDASILIDRFYECMQERKFEKEIYQDTVELDLSRNILNGIIPESLGQLFMLSRLDLSFNSFTGKLTEAHFSNLLNLDLLELSYNHLELNFSQDWVPPFNASTIGLCSCKLGPDFPKWLQTQSSTLVSLCLSEAGISDSAPAWLWDFEEMSILNLSRNLISGQLPQSVPSPYLNLDLSYNNFDGYLPLDFVFQDYFVYFSLSHNRLTGSVPLYFCNSTSLLVLDLSNNNFSGSLPLCQNDQPMLNVLDLSNNNLSGYIPDFMGFYPSLQSLHLRNNKLTGKIPWSLKHCKQLVILDLGNNRLSGNIPEWIGESLSSLRILSLRSNFFYGKIPEQLSHLTSLQVLDFAHNEISSTLPPTFGNFKAMAEKVNGNKHLSYHDENTFASYYQENLLLTTNGVQLEYVKIDLSLAVSMDLSNNNLYGQIPEELTNLVGLHTLNLSRNYLTGKIPDNIGAVDQLESLDLSMNNLEGRIPSSISSLNFLHWLNLSHNNLSGRIPLGYQLQTFNDPSIYAGNFALCGPPLHQCPDDESSHDSTHEENQVEKNGDKNETIWLYASIALGFIMGFWSVQVTLMVKLSLRIAYFHFVDNVFDHVYMKLAKGKHSRRRP